MALSQGGWAVTACILLNNGAGIMEHMGRMLQCLKWVVWRWGIEEDVVDGGTKEWVLRDPNVG